MPNIMSYLEFQKLWNVKSNRKHNHADDVICRMASSDMDP